MPKLADIVSRLDAFFEIQRLGADPSFSRHLPRIYEAIGYDWRGNFEPEFGQYFNGLMLRGADEVRQVFCACFPTPDVMRTLLEQATPGDLLFLHHPLDMECGDPQGEWGRGFLPIDPTDLRTLQEGGISVYSCHIPLDIHASLSTTLAMTEALNPLAMERVFPAEWGYFGALCTLEPRSLSEFSMELMRIYHIPYIDYAGPSELTIRKVALVAGVISDKNYFEQARLMGADAWLTGEFHPRIEGERGRRTFDINEAYAQETGMGLFGVSHAASEFLVMKTQLLPWLRQNWPDLDNIIALPQAVWWR